MPEGVEYLERQCQRPGLWLVEGHTVERIARSAWAISFQGEEVARAISFKEALEAVVDLLNGTYEAPSRENGWGAAQRARRAG